MQEGAIAFFKCLGSYRQASTAGKFGFLKMLQVACRRRFQRFSARYSGAVSKPENLAWAVSYDSPKLPEVQESVSDARIKFGKALSMKAFLCGGRYFAVWYYRNARRKKCALAAVRMLMP